MSIDRRPSTVIMVIDRIYHPVAKSMGITLLLRNEIKSEIQLPPEFFINLIQITGNLVDNAVKFTSPNGIIDVVFTMDENEDFRTLNMTFNDTGKVIPPNLVSAFNQGKQNEKVLENDDESGFGFRLKYVLQLVSKERGRIFVKSGKDTGTTFSFSFPLEQDYLSNRKSYQSNTKNRAPLHFNS